MSTTLDLDEATPYSPPHPPQQPTLPLDLSTIIPALHAAGFTVVSTDAARSRTRIRSDALSIEDRVIKALELFEHRGGSGRMMEELFDPEAGPKLRNAATGFYKSAHFCNVLDLWWDDNAVHSVFKEWLMPKAIDLVKHVVEKEMAALAKKYLFRMQDATPQYLLEFELDSCIRPLITSTAPVTYSLLYRALQSDRAARENKLKTPDTIAPVIMSQIIGHLSQNANLFAIPFGLCQWAAGVPRQTIDTCAKIGLSVDYTSLNKAQAAVSLRCMELACEAAREHHSFTYDNMQVLFTEHVEQRPDAPPKVLTGTAMTIYPLRGASDEACLLKPIIERRNALQEITFRTHVRPTIPILERIEAHQDIHIVEILLKYSKEFAPLASHYSSAPALKHAARRPPPAGYKTTQFPLRATTIAENTVKGNIEVWREAYEEQLKMDPARDLAKFAIPSINDQATNAHIRSAQARRKHDITSFARLDNAQLAPGMFHVLLNTAWYLLNWHRGDAHDLGSIQSFITLLQKKRHGSDKPDYHSLKATEMQILDGLVLHAWELECGFASLADFAASEPTLEDLLKLASEIRLAHASTPGEECRVEPGDPQSEDGTRRNTKLLLRDLLYFRTLHDAIKSGDFGRVEDLLGWYTIFFCGVGARNYTTEFLHFIQNLTFVWPPEFADVMRDNVLVNMSGRDGHWTGIDENMEHNIHYNQEMFVARGITGDWERLGTLTPATHIWRSLKKTFRATLGVGYKGISHSEVNTTALVEEVKSKGAEWKLLTTVPGRSDPHKHTVDAISKGKEKLRGRGKGPVVEFHKRRRAWLEDAIVLPVETDDIPLLERAVIQLELQADLDG